MKFHISDTQELNLVPGSNDIIDMTVGTIRHDNKLKDRNAFLSKFISEAVGLLAFSENKVSKMTYVHGKQRVEVYVIASNTKQPEDLIDLKVRNSMVKTPDLLHYVYQTMSFLPGFMLTNEVRNVKNTIRRLDFDKLSNMLGEWKTPAEHLTIVMAYPPQ